MFYGQPFSISLSLHNSLREPLGLSNEGERARETRTARLPLTTSKFIGVSVTSRCLEDGQREFVHPRRQLCGGIGVCTSENEVFHDPAPSLDFGRITQLQIAVSYSNARDLAAKNPP